MWCGQRQKISRGKGQELHPCCSADSTDDSASAAVTATSLRRRREAAAKGFAFSAAASPPRQEADLQGSPRAPGRSPLVPPLRRLSIDDGVPGLPLSSACRARWRRSRDGRRFHTSGSTPCLSTTPNAQRCNSRRMKLCVVVSRLKSPSCDLTPPFPGSPSRL